MQTWSLVIFIVDFITELQRVIVHVCAIEQFCFVEIEFPVILVTGRMCTTCMYLDYSKGKFEVFRPRGVTRCTNGGQIWQGQVNQGAPFSKFWNMSLHLGICIRGSKVMVFTRGCVFPQIFSAPSSKTVCCKKLVRFAVFLPSIDVFSVLTAFFPDNLASLAPVR